MKKKIIEVAIALAKEQGLINLTRQSVSQEAGIKEGSWSAIVGCTFTELLNEIRRDYPTCPEIVAGVEVIRTRISPERRRTQIMSAILDLSEVHGYTNVTRAMIAEATHISEASVVSLMGTLKKLRRDTMRHAIKEKRLIIIAQGVEKKDVHALKAINASEELHAEIQNIL